MSGAKGRSGGRRAGSGRKPLTAVERELTGNAGHRGRVLTHPGAVHVPVVAPIVGVEPPDDLTSVERQVWVDLAPHAIAARTLTPATALTFRMLCRNVVLEQVLATGNDRGGPNHRGILQRVESELARFCLAPFGKAIYEADAEPATPANPLEKFLKRG
jgi:hypothetical protein